MAFSTEEIQEFLVEAEELLDGAESSLIAMEKGEPFTSHYDAIFRAFHSIKGAAGMMEMNAAQAHMHQLENLLVEQKAHATLSKPYVDLFLRGIDATRSILQGENVSFDYDVSTNDAASRTEMDQSSVVDAKDERVETRTEKHNAKAAAGRVVLVDDEPDIVQLCSDLLRGAGFEVHGTAAPETALDLISSIQPDMLVTDINMPNLNGVNLLAQVKEKYPDIPVIFLSGYVDKHVLLEAIPRGLYGVIEKPFQSLQMIHLCLAAANESRLRRLLTRTINLLVYQFADLDDLLRSQGKDDVRTLISHELNTLLEARRGLTNSKRRPAV